jgi:hypothetical protein
MSAFQPFDIQKLLREAKDTHLWGTIQLDFQEGQLVLVRHTKTIKVDRENNHHDCTSR